MRRQKTDKLKWVLDQVPHGHVVDTLTLERHGITRKLAHKYIESGWLEPVIHGLYRRPSPTADTANWRTIVRSLQYGMDYGSVVGGRTALELHGFGHYLPLGKRPTVHLYGDRHPTWLRRLNGETNYILHSTRLFAEGTVEHVDVETSVGNLKCSSPERAILELIDELPHSESFHIVDTVFEGLASMRPRRVIDLLWRCRSVKVKRLFFVFADRHGHAWRKHAPLEGLDLGSGDRALIKGGKLHPIYRITIPEDLLPDPRVEIDNA